MQKGVKNFVIGRAVPLVGTAGLQFEKTQIHACGMVLLAESIAILIVAMNLPADKLPLVKNINADFVKRSTGGMRGRVILTDEQIQFIQNSEKGELPLEVEIIDQAGVAPIKVTVTAVWIPKKRSK